MSVRYPENRPWWLGPWQPWPCGRCGVEVGEEEHECEDQIMPAIEDDDDEPLGLTVKSS